MRIYTPHNIDCLKTVTQDDALGFSDPSRLETIGAAIVAAGKAQIIILCTLGRFTHVGNAEVVRF